MIVVIGVVYRASLGLHMKFKTLYMSDELEE